MQPLLQQPEAEGGVPLPHRLQQDPIGIDGRGRLGIDGGGR